MPKARLTTEHAEAILLKAGFRLLKTRGSHRIYMSNRVRIIVPVQGRRILHPKVTNKILDVLEGT